ncbi:MAG: HD domain-containing protein [Anaerolineae bacterium]|jgi:(p)ppGpp synthase/HD superfamily hydrolase
MEAFSERYNAALILAAHAHQRQTRKGGNIPYIIHPVHVSVILLRHGFSEDVAIGGLLHDVVEDSDIPLTDIEAEFGPAVADIVAALTERKREEGVERPWETRKREALNHLRAASIEATAVKAADVLHNTRTLAQQLRRQGPSIWGHYSRGPEQSLWFYRAVAAIARERMRAHPLTDELDEAVEGLAQAIQETEVN